MIQLKGKKDYVIGKFINEEMQQYVHNKLYMHDGIMPMTLNIEHYIMHVCPLKGLLEGQKDVQ